jgi:hypothetical protein
MLIEIIRKKIQTLWKHFKISLILIKFPTTRIAFSVYFKQKRVLFSSTFYFTHRGWINQSFILINLSLKWANLLKDYLFFNLKIRSLFSYSIKHFMNSIHISWIVAYSSWLYWILQKYYDSLKKFILVLKNWKQMIWFWKMICKTIKTKNKMDLFNHRQCLSA